MSNIVKKKRHIEFILIYISCLLCGKLLHIMLLSTKIIATFSTTLHMLNTCLLEPKSGTRVPGPCQIYPTHYNLCKILKENYGYGYLQRGTLQVESDSSQMEEWSLKSCHILLHLIHPPFTLFLQFATCWIESCNPWHVENLLHGDMFLVGSLLHGPTLMHPSVQICSKQSMASLNWIYKFCSFLRFLLLFLNCTLF